MPIHLQATDIDVVDPCCNESVKVPLCRRTAVEVIAAAPIDTESPRPRINAPSAGAHAAFDRRKGQQQTYGNSIFYGCFTYSHIAMPEICDSAATILRRSRGTRDGEKPDGNCA